MTPREPRVVDPSVDFVAPTNDELISIGRDHAPGGWTGEDHEGATIPLLPFGHLLADRDLDYLRRVFVVFGHVS